ncbi:ABC transporter ATP-binding protein [Bordetella genomosp. 10]|uniref:ABC transporter ATP-binding protein n=1 Tax=Bordetella genomosp. 10 TaxID=1416804 RepID=A0A261S561_9BORD|nr:ABC transporter ATP-binding protein [Bordetella genomosp. 10]OZI32325.1 ABC transporter ATP-binding protein [Bordetella genomosp. 10]
MLTIDNLQVGYGHIQGTRDVSLDIEAGETVALIGANGAGKSSTLKAVLGLVRWRAGDIHWEGRSLKGRAPHDILKAGIGFSPEGRRVFAQLSVQENLRVGGYTRPPDQVRARMEQIYGYFPRLKERHRQDAGSLSGGEQQMLAIGRALMSYPRLFLLDEPSLGLAPIIVERIGDILREIQQAENLAIMLAEQNATWALSIAHRGVILEMGRDVDTGSSQSLRESPKIRSAYLGL